MVKTRTLALRYTPEALAELDSILTTIATASPHGARRVNARIEAIARLTLQFPKSGRLTSILQLRRLVVTPYPYLIFYQHIDDEIVIIGVRHAARDEIS